MTSVLVVDDDPAISKLVILALTEVGCDETLAALDAEAALDILATRSPDVIITDVRLPGVDGVELARRVRARAEFARTPIVLMSAYGEPAGHRCDAFLGKPFEIDDLVALVRPYM